MSVALIIDIEASGLDSASFPIEIGWCRIDGGEAGSLLIRPEPDWDVDGWDSLAEEIHGIGRDQLHREGIAASDACRRLRAVIGDSPVHSDAHHQDGAWLRKLFEAEWPPGEPVEIRPVQSLIPERHRALFLDRLEILARPHRALADARAVAALVREFTTA